MLHQLVPAAGGMNVHLNHTRVRRDFYDFGLGRMTLHDGAQAKAFFVHLSELSEKGGIEHDRVPPMAAVGGDEDRRGAASCGFKKLPI